MKDLELTVTVEPMNDPELGAMNGIIQLLSCTLADDNEAKARALKWCLARIYKDTAV
jgi:hypothetical protein